MRDKDPHRAPDAGPMDRDLTVRWRLIGEGYRRTHRAVIAQVEKDGINSQWFEVMARLVDAPQHRLPMSKLAAEVSMTSGGLTKLVDRLEQAGLAERQSEPSDRRVVHAALTRAGVRSARSAIETYERGLAAALAGRLTTADLDEVSAVMSRLTHPGDDEAATLGRRPS